MIFLKRIEAFGFKSFADPISLNFEYGMTGIVGPNGSGKSNINDAIRWTLGEQSLKSLRGDTMEDIVFSGSEGKKGYNIAEVTLVFDNSNSVFSSLNFSEVSIKRKYDKINNESEYFINGTKVRQKDVQEIALETGLTKSSLAIISQGSVNNFVEAKPEERRKIFDEAAGAAKYKKRKDESVNKLRRSRENLDRINDIINELERRLPSLKKQSEKAKIYQEKENQLKEHEVAFLVNEVKVFSSRLQELEEKKYDLKSRFESVESEIKNELMKRDSVSKEAAEYDKKIANLNKRYTAIIEQISKLEVRKISFESKINEVKMGEGEYRAEEIKRLLKENDIKISSEEKRLHELSQEENRINNELVRTSEQRAECNKNLDQFRKEMNKYELKMEQVLEKKENSESLFEGVKNILNNKKILPGVIGTIQSLINVEEKYINAISAVLQQGVLQNIVIDNASNAKIAIDFLKTNRGGFATFLPLDTIKSNVIDSERRFIISQSNGFVNFANELVKINNKYNLVLENILGAVIVVDNYDNALEMAKIVKYKFNIVTLDGERIMPHGAIVGGSRNKKVRLTNDEDVVEDLKNKIANYEKEIELNNKKVAELSSSINLLREQKNTNVSATAGFKTTIKNMGIDSEKLRDEYRLLTGKDLSNNEQSLSIDKELEKIISEISELENEKSKVKDELDVAVNMKGKISESQMTEGQKSSELNSKGNALREELSKTNTDILLLRERRTTSTLRLAEKYNLTFEAALDLELDPIENFESISEIIKELRQELNRLGNVNLDSITEYNKEQSRYEDLTAQANDIQDSINNIWESITSMDEQMEKQFKKVVNDVNETLPAAVKTLFGGGEAKIIYTDPSDILNSGIEIKIQPPGKKISNLNLLSGGEKSLVALSVLFSILSVRPLPLVILDEVEAPLDVANVERFAKYIRSFIDKTQFLIVTHRMGTMENCDVLYGATMEQKGITKIVNVNLIEAKKISNAS